MILLYWLNIIAFVATLLAAPIYVTRRFRLPWTNPVFVPMLVQLPVQISNTFIGPYFFLRGSLFNPYFQYALAVNNVHAVAELAALVVLIMLFTRERHLKRLVQRAAASGGQSRPERMRMAAAIFYGLFVLSFLALSRDHGAIKWLLDPRNSYINDREANGEWYAFCLTSLSTSVVLATVYARSNWKVLLCVPLYIASVYTLGSKGLVLDFAIYFIVILAIRNFRYFRIAAFGMFVVGMALVASLLVASFGRLGIAQIAEYADYYVNAAKYYDSYLNGQLPLYQGEISLTNFWGILPRALVPDKPLVYGPIIISEHFFPDSAEEHFTPTFSTTENFADFGWPQDIVYGVFDPSNLLTAFLYALVLPRLSGLKVERRFLTYGFLWLAAPNYLQFFTPPLNLIVFVVIVSMISFINRVRLVSFARPSMLEMPT